MIKEGKFGTQEAVWLTTIAITAKVFFTSPATLAGIVGNTSWYTTLISAAVAMIGFLFIYRLLSRFPGKDIAEIFDLSLGRFAGFAFSGVLALYMLFISTTRLAEFNQVIKVYVFPLSPNWYIIGLFIVSVFILSRLGIESIARFSKLLIYFMLAGFTFILILNIQNYNVNNLYPILGYGLDKTITTGIIRSSAYGEIIILAIFAGTFQGLRHIKKQGVISIILSALLICVSLLAFTLVFPYHTAQNITAPMYEMATLIDLGRFLQRVETIFLFIWIISTLISTTIIFYSFVWLFCKMFRIQDKKPVILGGAILLYAVTLMHKDIMTVATGSVQLIRSFGSVVIFILPLVALIVAAVRKKGRSIMRKAASIVCLIILVLGLSSCYDANEIDDMLHVVTIGVDQGISNKWRLSLQFSTMKEPNGGGEESSGESKSKGEYASVTIDAPSFFTGIDMLNASLPRKLTFAHAQFIVFSEELAESGLIGEYIAPIKRFKEIRDTAHIFVIKGKAEKFLKENQPFVGNMLSKNFEMFINEGDNTGFFPRVTLENFYSGIISTYHQPIAPLAAINDFKAFQKEGEPFGTEFNQGGHYIAGELPRSGENKIELFGTALFDEDTMVGQLDGDETRYMLMARGDFKRGFFTMKDPKKPELIIPLDITASRKPKTKVTFDDTKPVIHLKIHLDVDLLAVQSRINYEEAELRALLEEEFKKTVKDGVEKVIQKCQSLHTDVFMFGDYAARNFLTIDDLENYDWNNHFKDAKAVVEVEVTIRRTGTQIGSYQMNEEGDV